MAEIQKVSLVQSKPGIRRDGTNLDGEYYSDGKWVRFQRGRPKKMGGYSRNSSTLVGPVRDVQVWSRGQLNNVFTFSGNEIEVTQIDDNGGGSSVKQITPLADFTGNDDYLWSTDVMFDAAAGSESTIVLAIPTKTVVNIDDDTEHALLIGQADGSAEFEAISDVNGVASGGVFVTSPYAVLYGSDGKVTWSNANEPQNYTTGDSGTARITGAKIVQGHSIRSGSGASGLLWALDSLIKMEYIGGAAIFRFTKVGVSSILAQNSVIEYDGAFFWIGIDRFLTSNGATIAEIPNAMNLNWFFDNLNYEHRNKIWAMKIPRFGEIWWFYPRGDATECTHAIILNMREQCWYDCELPRSAGFYSQVFRYPIMFNSDSMYIHEKGLNSVEGDNELAIESYFTTADFGLPANQGLNRQTRVVRIEPDFLQTGDMSVEVLGFDYANSDVTTDGPYSFNSDTDKIDLRVQRRHLQLKFISNENGGFYEMGKTIIWTEPGDMRP